MAKIPRNYKQFRNQPAFYRPPRKPRFEFRWAIVLVPLALIFATWVLNSIRPIIGWDDIMDLLAVKGGRQRYSMLAILGLTCLGYLTIKRIVENDRK
ncbi:MAG TPA: hypothetical protein ENH94_04705 [Phycisphaerales bacterium]|nr:hypothetical protein [Phycisphaerales bacterium]